MLILKVRANISNDFGHSLIVSLNYVDRLSYLCEPELGFHIIIFLCKVIDLIS